MQIKLIMKVEKLGVTQDRWMEIHDFHEFMIFLLKIVFH